MQASGTGSKEGEPELSASVRKDVVKLAGTGRYTESQVARQLGVPASSVRRALTKKHAEREAVARAASRQRAIRWSTSVLILAMVGLTTIGYCYVALKIRNDAARATLVVPSKTVSVEPRDPKHLAQGWVQPVRVEIHREGERPSLIGSHSDFSLLVYFRVLLPPEVPVDLQRLEWSMTLPAGTTGYLAWHDQRWDQEPNEQLDLVTFDGAEMLRDKLVLKPFDFGVHEVVADERSRPMRVLQYGVEVRVPSGFAIGSDPDLGLAAESVALRWSPASELSKSVPGADTVNLSGNKTTLTSEPYTVELVACAECFVLSAEEPTTKTGLGVATTEGSSQDEITLMFKARHYPWAWIVDGWFRGLVAFLAVSLAGVAASRARRLWLLRSEPAPAA